VACIIKGFLLGCRFGTLVLGKKLESKGSPIKELCLMYGIDGQGRNGENTRRALEIWASRRTIPHSLSGLHVPGVSIGLWVRTIFLSLASRVVQSMLYRRIILAM
jgi:hypothetical protein